MPDRLPASAPPSPLGAVLDVVGGIAAFTPYGPVVALAIGTAKFAISFAEENELGKFKAETAIKDTVIKLKAMQPQEERKGLSEEDRKKLGTAVWRAQVSGSDKIKAVSGEQPPAARWHRMLNVADTQDSQGCQGLGQSGSIAWQRGAAGRGCSCA